MDMFRVMQFQDVPWQAHPTITGVMTKVFENRDTQPLCDALLAQVFPGGKIPWHVHAAESETAYVVQGTGTLLCAPENTQSALDNCQRADLVPAMALTVRSGVWHSVLNSGDAPLILFAFHTPPTL